MSNIKVSVIIPVYNMGIYMTECLDSVIEQTLKEIEIICINDGSTDNSQDILQNYCKKDNRIKVIQQENQGAAVARNQGIKISQGEFICFMDPDDWYPENDILEYLYNKAKENNVLICGGSFSEYLPDGGIITQFNGDKKKYQFKNEELIFYKYYQFDYGYHRFIYSREMIIKNRITFPLYSRFQDPPFFVKAMITAKKFYAVPKITYAYRVGSGFQKVVWTEKKLLDLISGVADNLRMSRIYYYHELHQLNVKRIVEIYKQWYIDILPQSSIELVEALINCHAQIDKMLLNERQIENQDYLIMRKIFHAAGYFQYDSILEEKLKNLKEEPKIDIQLLEQKKYKADSAIKVSIIVPVYNVELYLQECLETLIDQTLLEIEIICVDDGSTDDSLKILKDFQKLDNRIVVIEKKNGGLSSARNAGLSVARGEYVCFLDSDDYLEQKALLELYNLCRKERLDILYFDAVPLFESEEGAIRHQYYQSYYERKEDYSKVVKGYELYNLLEQNGDFRSSACLQIARTKFLRDNNLQFYEGIVHEDNLYTIQSMILANRVCHIPIPYYHRRLREESIMTVKKGARNVYGYFVTIQQLINFKQKNLLDNKTINSLNRRIKLIENLIFDIYIEADDKNMDCYLKIDEKPMFDIMVNNSYEYMMNNYIKKRDFDIIVNYYKDIEYQFHCMKNSTAFKIGRSITYIPRKIRTIVRVYREEGIKGIILVCQYKLKR